MGKLALAGVHLEGTPLGEFADAAWAVQVDYLLAATQESAERVDALWDQTVNPPAAVAAAPSGEPEQLTGPTTRDEHGPPSPADILAWASDPRAQAGQRALMGQTNDPQTSAAPSAGS